MDSVGNFSRVGYSSPNPNLANTSFVIVIPLTAKAFNAATRVLCFFIQGLGSWGSSIIAACSHPGYSFTESLY